jgi:hypothetical protein
VPQIFLQQQSVHPAGELFGQMVFKTMGTLAYSGNINAGANPHGIHQMDGVRPQPMLLCPEGHASFQPLSIKMGCGSFEFGIGNAEG